MANQLNDHVLIVDTADAANVAVGGEVITEEIRARLIRWVPAAGGNTVVVQNGDGDLIWSSAAGGSTVPQESRGDIRFRKGIRVTTLGGTLFVYFPLDESICGR